uniref:Olfactory receptor 52N5-like n=1 Tax=Cynoglossus semilaevis TaxID=244447 RepID=A0A3P8X0N3_CYNSE
MENYTYNSLTLQLEGLLVSEDSIYPLFLFLFVSYLFIIVANVGIAAIVFMDKNLHQPMYLLFWNLSFNDILGNSILLPRLLINMMLPVSKRIISYYECVVQAFILHMYGTTTHTALMIMALDRYVAICKPLQYANIMTNKMLSQLTFSAWGVSFVLVGIFVVINNIYGLIFTVVLFSGSIGSMVLTYTKIAIICLTSKSKSVNSKALKTCSTHLVLYLIMMLSGLFIIILHRFPEFTYTRKIIAILYYIVPGSLNPVIYGMQSKEICAYLYKIFRPKKNRDQHL